MKKEILRLIDANLNRAREGLRVCEDILRFIYNNKLLTLKFKDSRHRLNKIAKSMPVGFKKIIAQRNTLQDIGKHTSIPELKRCNVEDIFYANIQRTKESTRVLEEFSKLLKNRKLPLALKKLRFSIYELEKKARKIL